MEVTLFRAMAASKYISSLNLISRKKKIFGEIFQPKYILSYPDLSLRAVLDRHLLDPDKQRLMYKNEGLFKLQ